ncbi:MAG: putative sulfate exporter family transporter [Bacteroidetes bacterium]|nr:putative sulfate exporter family transporter [Bacteroidia bacterium]PCH69746.1 MAG: putative sulfate exporter family transporter [Bacteroidota bacterium]
MNLEKLQKPIFFTILLLTLTPWISPPIALILGIVLALTIQNPIKDINHRLLTVLLKVSIVGIGFGLNVNNALEIGKNGLLFTVFSVLGTVLFGLLLGKLLLNDIKISHLISSGTAICGGTAVAAISPVIKANEKQISVALGTVFILNAVGLLLFPIIGEALTLSQTQFGFWSALAIHDTSSVVGAASKFGEEALLTAATVKLGRTLWIIPFVLVSSLIFKSGKTKIQIPYFILLFIIAMILSTYIPAINSYSSTIVMLAKKGFTVTLFLVGAGLSKEILKEVGVKPLLQGVLLWVAISVVSLLAVMNFIS